MSNAFEKMKVAMELRGFAEKTQKKYLYSLKRFSDFFGKPPEELGYDEVREFLYHEIKVRKLSSYYVNASYGELSIRGTVLQHTCSTKVLI
ncbi:MAG TPA: phage integrase N-terminal SAM-like domain-containing protein [Clostridiales bacterium]|nr:phage integrase N-terminal SAM-like domain-containing protein [Clostridiales bacterium]